MYDDAVFTFVQVTKVVEVEADQAEEEEAAADLVGFLLGACLL